MREIHYNTKYLSMDHVNSCFRPGNVTHVDKVLCGNGFSTSFLKIKPTHAYQVNIVIAPNRGVVIGKHKAYLKTLEDPKNPPPNRIKFFYKGSKDINFENAEVLFFVADSFLNYRNQIYKNKSRIDKILLDEWHTTEYDSVYRFNLQQFLTKVERICTDPRTSISTVTATPNLFAPIDIQFIKKDIPETKIYHGANQLETMKRIKRDIKQQKEVVIFTNSSDMIKSFKKINTHTLEANFIIGTNLNRSSSEKFIIKHNEQSNTTILSSKGFEGLDLDYENAHVYFFENRRQGHETFTIGNLYQAINRTRKGAKSIELCRIDSKDEKSYPFKDIDQEITKFLEDDEFSNEKKLSKTSPKGKNQTKFHPFINTETNTDGSIELTRNQIAINKYKEAKLYDKPFVSPEFQPFLEKRNISIYMSTDKDKPMSKKTNLEFKKEMLYANREYIKQNDLFGDDYQINPNEIINETAKRTLRQGYKKYLEKYFMRKDYDREYQKTPREAIAWALFNDDRKMNDLIKAVTKTNREDRFRKYGQAEARKKTAYFKEHGERLIYKLILAFAKDKIGAPSRWIAHRNYNIWVEISLPGIRTVAEFFDVTIKEIDIVSANPRIMYALAGLPLPADFYGPEEGRAERKKSINTMLNNFFYRPNDNTHKTTQKENNIQTLLNLGYDPIVIDYMMSEFFECKYRGDLTTRMQYHEKNIIGEIKAKLSDLEGHQGIQRRHDSLIIFNNELDLTFLNEYQYLDQGNWFKKQTENKPKFDPDLALF